MPITENRAVKNPVSLDFLFKDQNSLLESPGFTQVGFWGGATAGLICSFFVILMKGFGYANLPMSEYAKLWPKIIFFGTTGGALGGWLACRLARTISQVNESLRKKRLCECVTSISGFFVLTLVHQMSVRDSLNKPGIERVIDGVPQVYGGLLGKPNFETIAAGLLGGSAFMILVKALSQGKHSQKRFPLTVALKSTIVGTVLWSLTFLVFFLLTEFDVLTESQRFPPDPSKSALFIVDFSHPEHTLVFVPGCLIYIYTLVVFVVTRGAKPQKVKLSQADQKFLDKIVVIIEENMGDMDFGPVQLAEKTGYYIRTLNRKVKKLTDTNTTLFIRRLRLQHAVHLIEENFGNIAEIGCEVGFANTSYFTKCFKEYTGLTPSNYRERFKPSSA